MPRSSPYVIKLSSAEEAELGKRGAKFTLPYSQVQRPKVILYAAQGLSNDEIAACLDTNREAVSLWRKRFFADRLAGVEKQARPGRPGPVPPVLVVPIRALACELPARYDRPSSRGSTRDLVRQVQPGGLVAAVSGRSLWRRLREDAIRPWVSRSWVFPRDPDFAAKAGHLLDLRPPVARRAL